MPWVASTLRHNLPATMAAKQNLLLSVAFLVFCN